MRTRTAATNLLCVALAGLLSCLPGCATPPGATQDPGAVLAAAGFRAKAADSVMQQQQIRTLPAGRVSAVTHNGKRFYIYPEVSKNRLWVGNEEAYRRLRSKPFNPVPDSAGPVGYTIPEPSGDIQVSVIRDWRPFNDIP